MLTLESCRTASSFREMLQVDEIPDAAQLIQCVQQRRCMRPHGRSKRKALSLNERFQEANHLGALRILDVVTPEAIRPGR